MIEDHDGRIATSVASPPILPPMTLRMSMAWFERFTLTYLPICKVSNEEFDEMERINPPVQLIFRKCAFTSASVLKIKKYVFLDTLIQSIGIFDNKNK